MSKVSSLYGRVYRVHMLVKVSIRCFLPIREGVSEKNQEAGTAIFVSSLYGRVYRRWISWHTAPLSFLPIREGVSL